MTSPSPGEDVRAPEPLPGEFPDAVMNIICLLLPLCDDCCTAMTDGDLCDACNAKFDEVADLFRPAIQQYRDALMDERHELALAMEEINRLRAAEANCKSAKRCEWGHK